MRAISHCNIWYPLFHYPPSVIYYLLRISLDLAAGSFWLYAWNSSCEHTAGHLVLPEHGSPYNTLAKKHANRLAFSGNCRVALCDLPADH
jgi:hypothetical protein